MLKTCPRCIQSLPATSFNWRIAGKKLAPYCKTCSRKYIKKHYDNNRNYYIKKAKKRNKMVLDKALRYIAIFLSNHPCVDCGEKDILVLEFDHRDRLAKVEDISQIVRRGLTFKCLVSEISKCDVRCANCHRRKTNIENNSWRLKYAPVA